MKQDLFQSVIRVALFCVGIASLPAEPEVINVRVAQRMGTNLVDVYYDLGGAGEVGATVSVELSDNGGTSYGLPISALSGHVGSGVANGSNRHLIWNAGADRPNIVSLTMRLRLNAVDTPPVPDGFALIPAGAFTMGRTSGDTDSNAPPVTVNVSDFYMGKYEVTKAQWDEVRTWGVANGYMDLQSGGGKAANHPVHTVSWWDVVKWCNARSEKEGFTVVYRSADGTVFKTGTTAPTANWNANGYRLPTEAEWEKAARGGFSGQRFPWGDTITHSQANYNSTSIYPYDVSSTRNFHPSYNDRVTPYTAPVDSFPPNSYGLFNMCGNVSEWCWDWYSESTYTEGTSDPKGPTSGLRRVSRGGHFHGTAIKCRSANRYDGTTPGNAVSHFGFRPARSSIP